MTNRIEVDVIGIAMAQAANVRRVEAERDRYRVALEAVTRVEGGNSWNSEDDAHEWVDTVLGIVHDALAPPKE